MHWKLKALVQNTAASLPSSLSYSAYFAMQRTFGGLRQSNPTSRLRAGVQIVDRIKTHGRTVDGKAFFEVGTGRALALPMALWLCGADRTVTVDLNPYLTTALVMEDIAYIKQNSVEIRQVFGNHCQSAQFNERFDELANFNGEIESLLELIGVSYLAPADAREVDLPDADIDFHVSFTVLEHIPPAVMSEILQEGRRLLRSDGLFVHCIDFTDHFAHSDSSISTVNFLQFSEEQWERYAGNRYMYHNRLRVDEFRDLIQESGIRLVSLDVDLNDRSLALLENGDIKLDTRFCGKSPKTNAASGAWMLGAA